MTTLILLFAGGMAAGFINTLAGGGSIFTMTVLIMIGGVSSPVANMTNRVGILANALFTTALFKRHQRIPEGPKLHIFIPVLAGSMAGMWLAAHIDGHAFDRVLMIVLPLVVLLMLRPKRKKGATSLLLPGWLIWGLYFLVGFYGGFIQVGIGLILTLVLSRLEGFDLVSATAMKLYIVLFYSLFVVTGFIFFGQIAWKEALALTSGNLLGGYLGVKLALKGGGKVIRIILIIAVVILVLKLSGWLDPFIQQLVPF